MTKDKEIVAENDRDLDDLKAKEVETVFAMAITKTDQDAIKLSPYKERHFYRLKPKLEPYQNMLARKITDRARTALEMGSLEAAVELIRIVKTASSTKDRISAITEVLDRAGIKKEQIVEGGLHFHQHIEGQRQKYEV